MKRFSLWSIIFCSFVPGTEEAIYDEKDFDELAKQPRGGWITKLSEAASELISPDAQVVRKNSEKTTTG